MKDIFSKVKGNQISFVYDDRFLHWIQAKTGRAKQPTTSTVGMATATIASAAASATGVRIIIPANIEPRTSQRRTGRLGNNLYLQPKIEYFASCPI